MCCCNIYILFVHTLCFLPFSSHGWTQIQYQPQFTSGLTTTSTIPLSQCEPTPIDGTRGSIIHVPKSLRHKSYHHQCGQSRFRFLLAMYSSSGDVDNNCDDDDQNNASRGIDLSSDSRLYKVRLSRATGIDWGTDLSFSFVYVRALDPSGSAASSGVVSINDQLCEVTPISTSVSISQPINLIGAPFDYVMNTFANLDKSIVELDFVFFHGTRDELKAICTGTDVQANTRSDTITVTVVENKGSPTEMIRQLTAPVGVNVRELLVSNNINVYQSITRWTNCKGKQLCGTCIVNVPTGGRYTNRKSMDEASTLRENPDTYRLSCVSFAYGDITVETFPPINAAQWTR